MSDYKGRLRLRIDDERLTFNLLKSVAVNIFDCVRRKDVFPYDTNRATAHDPRKKWGSPWHLRSRGAAFVGGEKVAGYAYRGDAQASRKNVIAIAFSNIKTMKDGSDFDYAQAPNARTGKPVLPHGTNRRDWAKFITNTEINAFIDKAVNEYWDKL